MTITEVLIMLGILASIGMIVYIVIICLAIADILKNEDTFKSPHTDTTAGVLKFEVEINETI